MNNDYMNDKNYIEMNSALHLLRSRVGAIAPHEDYQPGSVPGVDDLARSLQYHGGLTQQQRMIRDKRRSLDRATLYSYQGARVKKYTVGDVMEGEDDTYRALINPNKLKPDYDDKVISIGFEAGFKCGDVFLWENTGTYWLIYNQNLTELAYFRGDIRKCSYAINYVNEDGEEVSTYAAIRGPVETRIQHWTKNGVEYNSPNYSLNLIIPKTQDNLKYFVRYAKFYLSDGVHNICWRVEAVDAFRQEGVIEFTAVEYYANEMKDDIAKGAIDSKIATGDIINPRMLRAMAMPGEPSNSMIVGESNIKAKRTYTFVYDGDPVENGSWTYESKGPLVTNILTDDENRPAITVKWTQTYGGTIQLKYGNVTKEIKVASLF